MHGASREDLPRGPQILSAALIRVLPDGFLLKAIVFTVCEHEYTPPPPQLSRLATTLTLSVSYVLPVITRAARFCSFSSLSKLKVICAVVPNKTAVIKMGEYISVSHACAF
jgi:hypothetical protein